MALPFVLLTINMKLSGKIVHTPGGCTQLWEESIISFKEVVGGEAGNEDIKKGKELSTKNKSELICLLKKKTTKTTSNKQTNQPPQNQKNKEENPTKKTQPNKPNNQTKERGQ